MIRLYPKKSVTMICAGGDPHGLLCPWAELSPQLPGESRIADHLARQGCHLRDLVSVITFRVCNRILNPLQLLAIQELGGGQSLEPKKQLRELVFSKLAFRAKVLRLQQISPRAGLECFLPQPIHLQSQSLISLLLLLGL